MKTNATPSFLPDRLTWIDRLRGIAALVIVVFHYHHFYLKDFADRPSIPPIEAFPYAFMLFPIYSSWAAKAVELFWMISGVVFLHVYRAKATTVWKFVVARFSRLYPLHLVTLLTFAALQLYSAATVGHWQIYGNNDPKHFLLQLAFLSNSINLSEGLSFNGPIWSISLEAPVYLMFLALLPLMRCAATFTALAALALSCGLAFVDLPVLNEGVFICAAYFFFGCLLYRMYQRAHGAAVSVAALSTGCIALGFVGVVSQLSDIAVAGFAGAIIVAALAAERAKVFRGQPSWLGDLSYSVYLVHVPIQIGILLCADRFFAGTRDFVDSTFLLPAYLAATLLVAHVVHFRLEKPVGGFLKMLLARKPECLPDQPIKGE